MQRKFLFHMQVKKKTNLPLTHCRGLYKISKSPLGDLGAGNKKGALFKPL
jgi:hypothetical protein